MTQAICDITTDEVNVDVVVEPQADTMVEVANRAGGMEQVFHDNTLIGNGNSVDLGVNTEIIATKEYVDEKVESIDTYTKDQIDGKLTAVDAQIDANADAIQKTREDYIQADSEIHQILNNHAENLTTLHNDVDDLGDQVAEIESKIPESASATNQLATKADLANVDLDGYVKKSGDTMTGDLVFDVVNRADIIFQDSTVDTAGNANTYKKFISAPHQTQGFIFSEIKNDVNEMQFSMVIDGFFMPHGNRLLGNADYPWNNVYAKKLNNGADIAIPTEGGTLARMEDLIDLRADINEADSELQTQITAQAAEIAGKQDQLTAGDNIVISGNVISATGAGGGAGFDIVVVQELPATGQKGIIYLLAKDGTAPDVYDEYVWITATQTFELIGTTAVDLTGYVKNTDYVKAETPGVVRTHSAYGIYNDNYGYILIKRAENKHIDAKIDGFMPITPITLDYAVKVGVTTNTIELTDDEKTSARTWIGAVGTTDYAGLNKVGIVGCSDAAATITNAHGYLQALTKSSASYKTADDFMFVSKGTLEIIKDDLVARATANAVTTQNLTVGTDEGTLNFSITAGVATIATNNGLDIAAQTKFDTAPTTDDNTTYANALDTSLVRKAQVATAIADAMANVDALPDQTGNAGKVLTTDGTNASWTEMPGLIIRRL